MPVNLYETLFLLDSTKLSADPDGVRGQLHATLERYGGEVAISRPWDDRKLTYPIRKQKKGSFHIVYYRIESTKQADLERDFKLNESLLRHLTMVIDPKWADAVMDVAHNDHGAAFAVRGMREEAAPGDVTPNIGDNIPTEGEAVNAAIAGRRPPRREPAPAAAEKPE